MTIPPAQKTPTTAMMNMSTLTICFAGKFPVSLFIVIIPFKLLRFLYITCRKMNATPKYIDHSLISALSVICPIMRAPTNTAAIPMGMCSLVWFLFPSIMLIEYIIMTATMTIYAMRATSSGAVTNA